MTSETFLLQQRTGFKGERCLPVCIEAEDYPTCNGTRNDDDGIELALAATTAQEVASNRSDSI